MCLDFVFGMRPENSHVVDDLAAFNISARSEKLMLDEFNGIGLLTPNLPFLLLLSLQVYCPKHQSHHHPHSAISAHNLSGAPQAILRA